MVEIAQNTPVSGPGLQAEVAPVSLETGSGRSALEAHDLTMELSSRYDLSSETSQQLGDILATSNATTRANLVDALNNQELSQEDRAAIIESLHSLRFETRRSELNNPNAQQQLLESTIERIADQYSGHQSDRRTCSVSCTQTRLAEDAVTYTQLIAGLTSPEGQYQFDSGATIRYIENSHLVDRSRTGDDPISSRDIDTRIVQSALMQFGAGYDTNAAGELAMRYDPQRDAFVDTVHGVETSGMYPDWMQRMNNAVFNEASTRLDTSNVAGVSTSPGSVIDAMQNSIATNGIDITAEITTSTDPNDPHSQHIIQVTEVRDGRVYFFNGWESFHQLSPSHQSEMTENGKIESMSVEDFQARLRSAYIPDPGTPAAEAQLTALQASRTYQPGTPESLDPHTAPPADTYKATEDTAPEASKLDAGQALSAEDLSASNLRDAEASISGRNPGTLAAASTLRQQVRKDDDTDLFQN